jgi:Na+-driven multidrug efflux pump
LALYFTHYHSHSVKALILHNKAFLLVGKPIHVAAYSIVSYTEVFFYLIFEGIALGTHPLVSFNTGAGLKERVIKFRNLAFSIPEIIIYIFAGDKLLLISIAIFVLTYSIRVNGV